MNDYLIDCYLDEIDAMSALPDNQPPMPTYAELEAEYHAMLRNPNSTRADFMCGVQIWHAIANQQAEVCHDNVG